MKTLFTAVFILLIFTTVAQKQLFVRAYDISGKKICKGNVYTTSDSLFVLEVKHLIVNIAVSKIGFIKTKHTVGNKFTYWWYYWISSYDNNRCCLRRS